MIKVEDIFNGVKLIKLKTHFDQRGFFYEFYQKPLYEKAGIDCEFVQDNHSFSIGGTIRGLHFQEKPGQAKLVSVIEGKILDLVLDIRKNSPTFGKWKKIFLDSNEREQLFIPVGFAHGFAVLSDKAHLFYKVSSVFNPSEEKTIRFNDPYLAIDWPFENPVVSERDRLAPNFFEVKIS